MYLYIYQYDQNTGFIGALIHGEYPDNASILQLHNIVVTTALIPATVETTHDDGSTDSQDVTVTDGWSFVLDNKGQPSIDSRGDYIVTPPPLFIPAPTINDHVFAAMVQKGDIDVTSVDPALVAQVNRAFDSIGQPAIKGTVHKRLPTFSAKTRSSSLARTGKNPAPKG